MVRCHFRLLVVFVVVVVGNSLSQRQSLAPDFRKKNIVIKSCVVLPTTHARHRSAQTGTSFCQNCFLKVFFSSSASIANTSAPTVPALRASSAAAAASTGDLDAHSGTDTAANGVSSAAHTAPLAGGGSCDGCCGDCCCAAALPLLVLLLLLLLVTGAAAVAAATAPPVHLQAHKKIIFEMYCRLLNNRFKLFPWGRAPRFASLRLQAPSP